MPTSLIPGRLDFLSASKKNVQQIKESADGEKIRFVSLDLHNAYHPYADDFGPVNLGIVHRF
jgi:hypothetical protein